MMPSSSMPGSAEQPRTILAVDDEPMLLSVLCSELEDRGYNVLRASTGEEAVAVLRDKIGEVDLLVTDIRLPGQIDGWRIAEEARRMRPDLPVIYVTGFFSQASREVSGGLMIIKPYRPSAIVKAAEKLWGVTAALDQA